MSRALRITGNIIKGLVGVVIFSVIALILWRIFTSGTPKELKAIIPNETLAAAYEEQGNDLYMFKQDQKNITTADRNRGYFSVTDYVIIPEANQIQLVFRYNNSTISHLAEDKGLSEVPSADARLFDVSLCIQTDLTPEDDSDNGGDIKEAVKYTRVVSSAEKHDRANLYNFYRYVFDFNGTDINLSELIESGELLAVYMDVYYVEEINYDEQAYGTLILYDYKADNVTKSLSASDRSVLKDYMGK